MLNKQLSLATVAASSGNTASQRANNPTAWSNMVVNTVSFARSIFTVTGKDMEVFIDQWVRTGGHARFTMDFVFNRKRFPFKIIILRLSLLIIANVTF